MLKQVNKKLNEKGFTLIELIVVIAILGILSSIALPRLGQTRTAAKISTHNSNVRIINTIASMYVAENPYVRNVAITNNIEEYFDDDSLPKVPKKIGFNTEKYIVRIDTNGNIQIEPDAK